MKYIKTFNEASKFQEEISKLNKKFISDKYDIMESNKKIIEDCFMHVSDLCETKIEPTTTVIDNSFLIDINIYDMIKTKPDQLMKLYSLIEESLEKCYLDLDTTISTMVLISEMDGQQYSGNTMTNLVQLKSTFSKPTNYFSSLSSRVSELKIRIILR